MIGNMPFMHGADVQPSYGQSQMTGYSGSSLPTVTDPEKTYASITRNEYQDFIDSFGKFEEELIAGLDDTSIIDEAPALRPTPSESETHLGGRDTHTERHTQTLKIDAQTL